MFKLQLPYQFTFFQMQFNPKKDHLLLTIPVEEFFIKELSQENSMESLTKQVFNINLIII